MHRDEDCQCPCSFCHIYSDTNPQQSDEAALIDGDDLGAEYGRKMFSPIELTPEDEDKVAGLLEGEDDHGG